MLQNQIKRELLPARPEIIEALAAQIPGSLWCVWKAIPREDGKTGKIPHKFKAGKLFPIGCDSPTQWVDWSTARHWYEAGCGASGIGILIGSNPKDNPEARYSSGLVALDIDNCLGPDGSLVNGLPLEVSLAVKGLQDAGVYLEMSPSGSWA